MTAKKGRKPSPFQIEGTSVTKNGTPIYLGRSVREAEAYLALCRVIGQPLHVTPVEEAP